MTDQNIGTITRIEAMRRNATYALSSAGYPKAQRLDDVHGQLDVTLWTSGDAIGLSGMPALHRAISDGVDFHGSSNGKELPGPHPAKVAAEQALLLWHKQTAARTFLSGTAIVKCLFQRRRESDGPHSTLLPYAAFRPLSWAEPAVGAFNPATPESLDRALATAGSAPPPLVVLESISSIDGTIAPLAEICSVAEAHGALVVLDESNAVGAYGPSGAGIAAAQGCSERIALVINSGTQALGLPLGYVAGNTQLVDLATWRIGNDADANPPAFLLDALQAAVCLTQKRDELRSRLCEVADELRSALDYLGVPFTPSTSHIICIEVGDPRQTQLATSLLRDHYGIQVAPVLPPDVAPGMERLRITCSALHTSDEIQALTLGLETLAIEMGWLN